MDAIKDLRIKKNISVKDLASQLEDMGGFVASKLGRGISIFKAMTKDKECVKFLSFPSCLMATGCRGALVELAKQKMVDVVITTAGTLCLDTLRSNKKFYQGSFLVDDEEVKKKGYVRLGSVFIRQEDYGPFFEDKIQPFISALHKEKSEWNTRDICWKLGEYIGKEDSFLYWCWKNKIPVFVPGITDGAIGYQLWFYWQAHKDFKLNLLDDEQELNEIVFAAKKTGALMLGGGISKQHVIWWNQFRGGLDYAVQISTAPEWDGSLSGAQTREAISWGKINEKAKHVTVEGDATVLLPILISAL